MLLTNNILLTISVQLVAEEKDDGNKVLGETSSDSSIKPEGVLHPTKCEEDQALVEFMKSETFEIAFHAQMTIGYITSNIAELEREFLLTRKPHRVPKGVAGNAAGSLQKLLDMVNMLHLAKIESHPFEKWPLSPSHLSYVEKFSDNFTDTLNFLAKAVLKPGTHIDEVLAHLEATENIAREHMHHNMNALLENKETAAENIHLLNRDDSLIKSSTPGGDKVTDPNQLASAVDMLCYMEDPITFLNYLEVCCCRQLRSLIVAVLHAVLIKKGHKILFEEQVSARLNKSHDDTTEYESRCGLEAEYFMTKYEDIVEEQKDGEGEGERHTKQ